MTSTRACICAVCESTISGSSLDQYCDICNGGGSKQPFRLLYLHPVSSTDAKTYLAFDLVTCNIHEVNLYEAPEYVVAVTRYGADEAVDHVILCNDEETLVTNRTYRLLLKLRGLGWQRIWLEDLCVDENEHIITADFRTTIHRTALRVFDNSPRNHNLPLRPQQAILFQYEPLLQADQIRLLRIDPRDKIYAFHGMAADLGSVPTINYDHSVEKVYIAFARYFVKSGRGFEMIDAAGTSRMSMELPSWVPDWSVSDQIQQYYNSPQTSTIRPQAFSAGGSVRGSIHLGSDEAMIIARGVFFDKILTATIPVNVKLRDSHSGELDIHLKMVLEDASSMISTHDMIVKVYPDLQEAFARTLVSDQAFDKTHEYYSHKDLATRYNQLLALYSSGPNRSVRTVKSRLEGLNEVDLYARQFEGTTHGRRFAVSEMGYMGLVPRLARQGDHICIIPGCKVPYVLRERGDAYLLVGDCYIHGIMYGEAMERPNAEVIDMALT